MNGFWLSASGNIDLGAWVAMTRLAAGGVATLRYSAVTRSWVLSS